MGYREARGALARTTLGAGLVLALAAAPAAAQWGTTWVGVAETSGDDITMLLASGSVSPSGLGLKPVVGLQGLYLMGDDASTWSVTPSAGLVMRAPTGALQARVGYTFSEDNEFPFFGAPDAGDDPGLSTSAQADYWDNGAFGLQGIASFNWGSEYLWTRARGTVRVMELDFGGGIHVGPEFVYQGEMGNEEAGDLHYSATQLGGIVQWNSGNDLIGAFGAGIKNIDDDFVGPDDDGSTWYVKLEFVLM